MAHKVIRVFGLISIVNDTTSTIDASTIPASMIAASSDARTAAGMRPPERSPGRPSSTR